jgi:light-regulated signal transduction histidine kinase (bacteriophytochrome)
LAALGLHRDTLRAVFLAAVALAVAAAIRFSEAVFIPPAVLCLVLALLLGLAFSADRLRVMRLKRYSQKLERDVTERTAELAAKNKELEAFSYSVSHDLRAPLRHIDGYLTLLKESAAPTLDEDNLRHIETIASATRRMSMLIDDLLSFSRMGRQEMSKTSVDLGALVADVVREMEPETEGRDVDWHIAELPVVTGDRAMLRVVLVNLISNALKFTLKRERAEITISCLPDQAGETVVFVRDNGAGFDMRYHDKLFGVFQRLHRSEDFEGHRHRSGQRLPDHRPAWRPGVGRRSR